MSDSGPFCVKCGADRSDILADVTAPRKPCACGATSVGYTRTFHLTTRVRASSSSSVIPARQDRDWKLRWEQVQRSLADLTTPHNEPRSAVATHAAAQDLFDFFIAAYHLKDALKADDAIAGAALEQVITHNATLALLADLANLDKHRKLTKPPRSGVVPVIEQIADDSSDETWRLVVTIEHDGKWHDGVTFAGEAVAEWRELLTTEGLI